MEIWYIIGWVLSGMISCTLYSYFVDKIITGEDILWILLFGLFGLLGCLIIIFVVVCKVFSKFVNSTFWENFLRREFIKRDK